ncbi:MAG: hypothetical protein HKN43_05455 [Rhodothermales bacterium]|nr:hypothetical protein [Rhodothermales bacterium]
MSELSLQIIQSILGELGRTRRRLATARVVHGLIVVVALVAIAWTGLTILESRLWLSSQVRGILVWSFAGATVLGLLFLVLYPAAQLSGILPGPSNEELARRIGRRFSSVSDRVLSVLSLYGGRHSSAEQGMLDGAIQSLSAGIDTKTFSTLEDFSRVKQSSKLGAGALVFAVLLFTLAPTSYLGASKRLLSPKTEYTRPLPFSFSITPGSTRVVKGSSVPVQIIPAGNDVPESIQLEVAYDGEKVSRILEAAPTAAGFGHTFVNVRNDFRYRIVGGAFSSEWFTVSTFERPVVRQLSIRLTPPAYSRRPRVDLGSNVGDISGLRGTRVSVEAAIAGPPIESVHLVFDDSTSVPLNVAAQVATGQFIISRSGSYRIALLSETGVQNADPIEYRIDARPDEIPSILILAPDDNTVLSESGTVDIVGRIIDDFGFSRLALFYRYSQRRFGEASETFESIDLEVGSVVELDQVFQNTWVLGEHGLAPVPGDEIELFVQVWDNDSYSGTKSTRSNLIKLRYPSLSEQYESLGESQENAETDLTDLLDDAEDVRKRFEELRDELRKNPDSDWQNNREMEQLLDQQERIEDRVDEFSGEIDDLIQQMEDNGLVSEETLDMYEELKKVSEEINSPELMDALEQLQDAIEQMSLDQMQDAIEKFEFSEDQYRQRLERTLDLFKQFKTQQSIDEVEKRAEELAKTEESLQEKTEQVENEMDASQDGEASAEQQEKTQKDLDQLAAEQERAKKELESLLDRLEEIKEEMKDVKSAPQGEMQQMTDQLEQENMPQKMQENADQLRDQQTQPAQQGQQQMQQQFNQMQQDLSQMQQSMMGSQMSINLQGLRRSLEDILVLSGQQENLRTQVERLVGDSNLLRGYAQQQLEISEGLSTVSDSLQKMAREIPQMSREVQVQTGEALREMGSAISAMSDRIARRATGHQKSSMMHMNELAVLLSDLLSQMMNQQSGMGGGQSMEQMVEQLQNMAGQQQKLNEQLQEMLNDAQGQRLTGDVQSRLNQLAQQQEELRKQLKQLSRNPDLRGKLLGDLNKIAEQMLESVDDLQRRRTNRNMVDRQKQILTRMLEATKSMQERGRENKRESETGRDLDRVGPDALKEIETADQLRRDLIRAMEAGYSPDYEALIKKYFQLLEQEQN